MRKSLLLLFLVLSGPFAAFAANVSTGPVTKVTSGAGKDKLTESLIVGSGVTLTIAAGGNITVSGGTASGFGGQWGSINGTLSDQTDLATALAGKQSLNGNLTAIAALSTTAFGRSVLEAADGPAARTLFGLVIGTDVQAHSANLDTFAGTAPGANVQSFLGAADYAAMRTQLSLGNVNNTSDANKPVSTATQAALDLKAPLVPSQAALTYASSIDLAFADGVTVKTLALAGDVTFTASNYASQRYYVLNLSAGASSRAITVPGGWKFIGSAAPRTIASGKTAVLKLTCFGTNEADVIALYDETPGSYLASVQNYFDRANVTDTAARDYINSLVTVVKALGLWSNAFIVPMRGKDNNGSGTTWFSLGGLSAQNLSGSGGVSRGGLGTLFDGSSGYLSIPTSILSKDATAWTSIVVASSNNLTVNSSYFDITENSGSTSVLARVIHNASASAKLQVSVRDAASHLNTAAFFAQNQYPEREIIVAQRNGSTVRARVNGAWAATDSTNVLGAMGNVTYNQTIGAQRAGAGSISNYANATIALEIFFNVALADSDIQAIEAVIGPELLRSVPLTRYQSTPVLALGTGGANDAGRILEPTVLKDGSTYKMWYSGVATNVTGFNQGWKVFYATSADGITWTGQGSVLNSAWEADVIKDGSTFYMAYVSDTATGVRLATSSDGATWTDQGVMVAATDASWSSTTALQGPREPCLLKVGSRLYLYYAATHTTDSAWKIGLAWCDSDPTVKANWQYQTTPLFNTNVNATLGLWNNASPPLTESPCVRYYAALPHPYVMSYISYYNSSSGNNVPYRIGLAWCDTPNGTFVECETNPMLRESDYSKFDHWIQGEATHLLDNDTVRFYYSGGGAYASTSGGANQIGLATISLSNLTTLQNAQ